MKLYSIIEKNAFLSPFTASILSLTLLAILIVGCGDDNSENTYKVGSLSIKVESSEELTIRIFDDQGSIISEEDFPKPNPESDSYYSNEIDPLTPGKYKIEVFEIVENEDGEEYTTRYGTNENVNITEDQKEYPDVPVELKDIITLVGSDPPESDVIDYDCEQDSITFNWTMSEPVDDPAVYKYQLILIDSSCNEPQCKRELITESDIPEPEKNISFTWTKDSDFDCSKSYDWYVTAIKIQTDPPTSLEKFKSSDFTLSPPQGDS